MPLYHRCYLYIKKLLNVKYRVININVSMANYECQWHITSVNGINARNFQQNLSCFFNSYPVHSTRNCLTYDITVYFKAMKTHKIIWSSYCPINKLMWSNYSSINRLMWSNYSSINNKLICSNYSSINKLIWSNYSPINKLMWSNYSPIKQCYYPVHYKTNFN